MPRRKTSAAGEIEPVIRVQLDVPLSTYERYVEAMGPSGSIESAINARILSAATHSDPDGVWISSETRKELQRLLTTILKTEDDVLSAVRKMTSLNVADSEIPLPYEVLVRLKSRAIGCSLGEYLSTLVRNKLTEEAGL